MEQDIAAQVVGLGGASDFSLWKLFLRADFVVKFEMIDGTANPLQLTDIADGSIVASIGSAFPNGSNGLDNYTHIVHHVKELSGGSGTADLSQALSEISAYDGDDLKLIITFGCISMNTNDQGGSEQITEGNNSSLLPHPGFIPTIMTILITSIIISRRNGFESIY